MVPGSSRLQDRPERRRYLRRQRDGTLALRLPDLFIEMIPHPEVEIERTIGVQSADRVGMSTRVYDKHVDVTWVPFIESRSACGGRCEPNPGQKASLLGRVHAIKGDTMGGRYR